MEPSLDDACARAACRLFVGGDPASAHERTVPRIEGAPRLWLPGRGRE